jgi:NAD(P)-dependent dehydrogenase (short-subunit alcohol dehydrogenase family)
MIERGRGSIVVIGSTTGKRPLYGRTPYAASKLGLVGLVRTLAVELGPLGVRVNLISPGAVAGPRIEGVIRAQARAAGMSYEAVHEEATKTTPLRRLIPPEDIAAAAIFLASDASASTTGEDLNVSGGLAMH